MMSAESRKYKHGSLDEQVFCLHEGCKAAVVTELQMGQDHTKASSKLTGCNFYRSVEVLFTLQKLNQRPVHAPSSSNLTFRPTLLDTKPRQPCNNQPVWQAQEDRVMQAQGSKTCQTIDDDILPVKLARMQIVRS